MTTAKKPTSLQLIIIQLRNDLELIERKWDTFTEGKVPNSGRENFLNGIQGYYRLRPTTGRQTFCIGDIAMVHDALHLHRRYNSRASVEKVLDVLVDLRLLRWNVERLLRTLSNTTNTVTSREKLLSLQNDTSTWKEVLDDKFSLVEMMAPSSPLFNRTLGDTLWRCVDTSTMMANYILEAVENQWPLSLQLMWRKLAAKEFNASAALENAVNKRRRNSGEGKNSYQKRGLDAKELDKLISRKQKLLKSMEADNRRKDKNDQDWEDSDEEFDTTDDFSNEISNIPVTTKPAEPKAEPKADAQTKKGVKVRFDDEASVISTEGNVTVHIINNQDRNDSRLSYQLQPVQAYPVLKQLSPSPQRATYIGTTKEDPEPIKSKPYMDLVKDNDDNLVVIRRPQMEKQILLPSVNQPINTTPRVSTATLRPARVLLTEIPEKSEPSVSTKDLKNIIEKVENLDGTVVDIHGDMRRELTRLRTSIKQRLRAVQQQVYDFDNTVDKVTNTLY